MSERDPKEDKYIVSYPLSPQGFYALLHAHGKQILLLPAYYSLRGRRWTDGKKDDANDKRARAGDEDNLEELRHAEDEEGNCKEDKPEETSRAALKCSPWVKLLLRL